MRGRRGLAICWLAESDSGPFDEPFCAIPEDLDRLRHWFSVLYSGQEFESSLIQLIVTTYTHVQQTNEIIFDIRPSVVEQHAVKTAIKRDIRSLFCLLRMECGIPRSDPSKDAVAASFLRILLFCQINGLDYRSGMCEILFPIFHVCYYGLWASPRAMGIPFQLPLIEALAADCFVRFLSRPPFCYAQLFDSDPAEEKFVEVLEDKLDGYQLGYLTKMIVASEFFAGWNSTLFSMDLRPTNLIKLWEWLFMDTPKRGFLDAYCAFITQLIVEMRDRCMESDMSDLFELLTDLSEIDISRVLERCSSPEVKPRLLIKI
jgi:hypothetical protein